MKIGLAYNLQIDAADESQAEFDPPRTIEALEDALGSLGHSVCRLGDAEALLRSQAALEAIDVVFNIAEGTSGRCREAWVPMLLERWGVPYVGSGPTAQALGLDKVMSKRLAQSSGVRTPHWVCVDDFSKIGLADAFGFPAIVKPRYEGSGLGIDPCSIVRDEESLRRRAAWCLARFRQPCIVEEFIPFGELTVFLIGNHPPVAYPALQRSLDPETRLSCHVSHGSTAQAWLNPVILTPEMDRAAADAARRVFEAIGCSDMARVDFRADESGNLYFLEINPLPSFDPEGSVGLLAEYLQVPYAALIGRILETAASRIRQQGRYVQP